MLRIDVMVMPRIGDGMGMRILGHAMAMGGQLGLTQDVQFLAVLAAQRVVLEPRPSPRSNQRSAPAIRDVESGQPVIGSSSLHRAEDGRQRGVNRNRLHRPVEPEPARR